MWLLEDVEAVLYVVYHIILKYTISRVVLLNFGFMDVGRHKLWLAQTNWYQTL